MLSCNCFSRHLRNVTTCRSLLHAFPLSLCLASTYSAAALPASQKCAASVQPGHCLRCCPALTCMTPLEPASCGERWEPPAGSVKLLRQCAAGSTSKLQVKRPTTKRRCPWLCAARSSPSQPSSALRHLAAAPLQPPTSAWHARSRSMRAPGPPAAPCRPPPRGRCLPSRRCSPRRRCLPRRRC